MLSCRDIANQSGDFIERQLPLRQRLDVRMHLLMCKHCRRLVRHLRKAITFFQRFPLAEINEAEAEQISRMIERKAMSDASSS